MIALFGNESGDLGVGWRSKFCCSLLSLCWLDVGWKLVGSWLLRTIKALKIKCDVGCLLVACWLDAGCHPVFPHFAEHGSQPLSAYAETHFNIGCGKCGYAAFIRFEE